MSAFPERLFGRQLLLSQLSVLLPAGRCEGWCRLRRLEVHAEIADLMVCHHWTPRSPKLPALQSSGVGERQLELDRSLT